MSESSNRVIGLPGSAAADVLTSVLRSGAQRLLAEAIEAEERCWIEVRQHLTNAACHCQVVRNGYAPRRTILTGLGPVEAARARPSPGRRSRAFFFQDSASLPATDQERRRADPLAVQHVYLWVDGVHFNIRLEEDRQCILVLIDATSDGRKELLAVADGYRESEQSWKALLLDVKARGLQIDPKLAVGDGALGFWKALPQVFPTAREQRCWGTRRPTCSTRLRRRNQTPRRRLTNKLPSTRFDNSSPTGGPATINVWT